MRQINVQPLRSSEEVAEVRSALSATGGHYVTRNLLLFNIGVNTGLRVSDIVSLRIEQVRDADHVIIREGKTKKRRKVYLHKLKEQILAYVGDKQHGWLFPSRKGDGHISTTQAYRILDKAAAFIGRDDIGTHTMRKTFGYFYYKQTKDIASLMAILNHSDQVTTKRYIGLTEEDIFATLAEFSV